MNREGLRDLHPGFSPWAEWLYDVAHANRLNPRVTSTFRSSRLQAGLYDRWRVLRARGYTNREIGERFGIWTPAPPGRSLHNYGLAFDMSGELLAELGRVWESVGGYWAGPTDPVHFAIARSVDDLR